MEDIALVLAVIVLVIVAVTRFASRVGVASPILLVVIGAAVGYVPGAPELVLHPHWILFIILPPLLYSAAITVPAHDFRRNFGAISALAVVLVIVSAVVVGFFLHWLLPEIGLAAAIALGAVVSPPDAVAATAVGKRLGMPERMVTVLEGEGLVNDATALVLLRTAIAAIAGAVSFWHITIDFLMAVAIGTTVGVVVGAAGVWIRTRLDDPVLTTAVSFAVPFLAFVPAEKVHASGVLAVVVAGLITGHGSATHFTASDRVSERTNWRTIQLLLENGVFLLMGYEMPALMRDVTNADGPGLRGSLAIAIGITAVLIALRMVFIFPLVEWMAFRERTAAAQSAMWRSEQARLRAEGKTMSERSFAERQWKRKVRTRISDLEALANARLGHKEGLVLGWAGMRGVITVAAAQTLPTDVAHRSELILVAMITLVGQGATLPLLIRKLGVRGSSEEASRRELGLLLGEIVEVMGGRLRSPNLHREDGTPFDPAVLELVESDEARLEMRMWALDNDGSQSELLSDRQELLHQLLDAAQGALLDARAQGTYSAGALSRAQAILDVEVLRLQAGDSGGH